ncbi:MAG: RdgB/HAM1 family non-canonical purine NTP pyrophosphatase [Chloroflexi bacterium]|nr:RdgB/HAM1 family non-canonical purine NTP pyrophosphatase [Chloroflexota bacterium]
MRKLLIATTNRGKLREFQDLLAGVPYQLTTPDQEGIDLQVDETGTTYEENARLKAIAYAQAGGLLTLADDSGLEVEALGGAPGPFAARFGGPGLTDAQRVAFLLAHLEGVPPEKRAARFRCVIVLATPEATPRWVSCEGNCKGRIAFEPHGSQGFGYDPIFFLPDLGQTMAELSPGVKNRVSHRAQAAAHAREHLVRGWPDPFVPD